MRNFASSIVLTGDIKVFLYFQLFHIFFKRCGAKKLDGNSSIILWLVKITKKNLFFVKFVPAKRLVTDRCAE